MLLPPALPTMGGQARAAGTKGGSPGEAGTKCGGGLSQGSRARWSEHGWGLRGEMIITSTQIKIDETEVTLQKAALETPQKIMKICKTVYKKGSGRKEGSRKVEIYEDILQDIIKRAGRRNRNMCRDARGRVPISYLRMCVHLWANDYSSVLVKAYENRYMHMQAAVYIHWYELCIHNFLEDAVSCGFYWYKSGFLHFEYMVFLCLLHQCQYFIRLFVYFRGSVAEICVTSNNRCGQHSYTR